MSTAIVLKNITASDNQLVDASDVLNLPVGTTITAYNFQVGDQEITLRDKVWTQSGQPADIAELSAKFSLEKIPPDFPYVLKESAISDIEAQRLLKLILSGGESIDARIEKMETELSAQRNLDQSQGEIEKLKKELAELEDQFGSVKSLIGKLNDTKSQLNTLRSKVVATPQQVTELRNLVLNFIRTTLKQPTGRITSVINSVKSYVQNMPLWPLLALTGINFAFALVQALTLKDMRIIILGLILVASQAALVVYFLSQQRKPEIQSAEQIAAPAEAKVTAELLVQPNQEPVIKDYLQKNQLGDVASAFVDNAMLQAYESEIEKLTTTINLQVGDTDVNQLQSQITAKQSEVNTMQAKIETAQKNVLTPDQYLRKRRELDMLKMEKRRENFEQTTGHWFNFISTLLANAASAKIDITSEWKTYAANTELASLESANGQLVLSNQPMGQVPADILAKFPERLLNFAKQLSVKLKDAGQALWPFIIDKGLAEQVADLAQARTVIKLKVS